MLSAYCSAKKKEVLGCSFLSSLYDREINGTKSRFNIVRATYQTVYPNCSIINVKSPTSFVRKFSPDGHQLLAFSSDLTSVEVYDYLGCSMANDLLRNCKDNYIREDDDDYVRNQIFDRLFKLKCRVRVSFQGETLIRTCSLFKGYDHYALVVTSCISLNQIPNSPLRTNIYSSHEALNPNLLSPLENYSLHLVNLRYGTLSHTLHFKSDKIYFNYNLGLYLFNDTLTVLSILHQIIYVYKIVDNCFQLRRKIGRFCYENDSTLISSVNLFMDDTTYMPNIDNSVNGLKHKLLVFLYEKAKSETKRVSSQIPLMEFYKKFDQFLSLRMWRMQLLDENHLFIRYASEEVASIRVKDPNAAKSYFMVYNMSTAKVLDIFENTSDELINLYEIFCDDFRNSLANPDGLIPCSLSNSLYSWESYRKSRNTISNFHGSTGSMETNKIVVGQLPVEAQSCTSSPYLDTSLYSYDTMRVSPVQVPRGARKSAIKFYSRKSGALSFSLHTGKSTQRPSFQNFTRMVEFAFHPTEPFVVSVVKEGSKFSINFHIRQVLLSE